MTTDTGDEPLAKRREAILAALAAAADPPPVLVAASKSQPDDALDAILALGHRVFGENRVQEASRHWAARRGAIPDLELHLIGPLQTNKAAEAVSLFDVIQTLDREKLAAAIADAAAKSGRVPRLMIQVNTGEEAQKAGVAPPGLPGLLAFAQGACGLTVTGLMCIPPVGEPAGPHFALLARLARDHGLRDLSMGMSGDYTLAARYGATHVRVGTALFGARD